MAISPATAHLAQSRAQRAHRASSAREGPARQRARSSAVLLPRVPLSLFPLTRALLRTAPHAHGVLARQLDRAEHPTTPVPSSTVGPRRPSFRASQVGQVPEVSVPLDALLAVHGRRGHLVLIQRTRELRTLALGL